MTGCERSADEPRNSRNRRIDGLLGDLYARYDSDPRVSGPDDFEAFADAIEEAVFDAGKRGTAAAPPPWVRVITIEYTDDDVWQVAMLPDADDGVLPRIDGFGATRKEAWQDAMGKVVHLGVDRPFLEIPAGWTLSNVHICPDGKYLCDLYDENLDFVSGRGSTWRLAIRAACREALRLNAVQAEIRS